MLEEIGVLVQFLINTSPRILIIIFCFYYIKKTRSIDGYLMITGSLILFFGVLISTLYYHYYFDVDNVYKMSLMNIISRVIRISGLGLFAIGFVMGINKYLKLAKQTQKE